MEVVDITDKFMLEVMFIKLQLPPPQFFHCQVGERFAVTMKFRPSTQHQRRDDEAMTRVYPLRRGSTSTAYVPLEDADTTSYSSLI